MSKVVNIYNICKSVPSLEELYNTRVRHYTLMEHTLYVLKQFETYFANQFSEFDVDSFRMFLLLHDIGKPLAHQQGNRDNQSSETIKIISENRERLNISDNHFILFKALLSSDALGLYIQNKIPLIEAYENIIAQSKYSGLEKNAFFYLLSVYYQSDAASYTKDAGGYKFLEYLFIYQDGNKVYNSALKLLQFSSVYNDKYLKLKNMIAGIQELDNSEEKQIELSNIKFIKGNIFNSKAQTIVNTVNCVGVMGKGIALVFKLRYPSMFDIYKKFCDEKHIGIGKLWLYNQQENRPWVLNFPTKFHWKYPSKMEYLEKGLSKFVQTYKEKNIKSIAFPLLGTHNGGLEREAVKDIMIRYLSKCDIPIEIYDYDPLASDDLFDNFKNVWKRLSLEEIKSATGIQPQYIRKINEILENPEVYSMVTLVSYDGIGEKTLQKAFDFAMNYNQVNLF
jgi:O-acetyl-ADP-ribose deacetylase (regulator of RNase III)